MNKNIKIILSSLRKERILMYKIIESDEKEDKEFFYNGIKIYNNIATNTDNLLKELINNYDYEKIIDYVLNNCLDDDELSYDGITLLGFINTLYLNKISNYIHNSDSDEFVNLLNSNFYNIYLWSVKKNYYNDEVLKEMRYEVVNTLVNTLAMREYFKGNFETLDKINYFEEDKNKKGMLFFKVLSEKVAMSNSTEMFEGMVNDNQFQAKKEILKLEFVSLATLMMNEKILISVVNNDMSDFTQNILKESSLLFEEYNKKEKIIKKVIKL